MNPKNLEIISKPYSNDVHGYFFPTPEGYYIVVNSNLPEAEAVAAVNTLKEAASATVCGFILLQGDGRIYMSDNSKLPEMSDAS